MKKNFLVKTTDKKIIEVEGKEVKNSKDKKPATLRELILNLTSKVDSIDKRLDKVETRLERIENTPTIQKELKGQ